MKDLSFLDYQSSVYAQNLQSVISFKAGSLLETYKTIISGNGTFVYDVHEIGNGINVSIEILPWSIDSISLTVSPHWINPNVFLMPYSGFCFPLKSSDPNENYQPDAGKDDHLFYQGEVIRGIELLVFGTTKEDALEFGKRALSEPEIQELINTIARIKK